MFLHHCLDGNLVPISKAGILKNILFSNTEDATESSYLRTAFIQSVGDTSSTPFSAENRNYCHLDGCRYHKATPDLTDGVNANPESNKNDYVSPCPIHSLVYMWT